MQKTGVAEALGAYLQTPSCDGMGPGNTRHIGDGSFCQAEDYLTPAEREATLGV
jgi:hypothetical protein